MVDSKVVEDPTLKRQILLDFGSTPEVVGVVVNIRENFFFPRVDVTVNLLVVVMSIVEVVFLVILGKGETIYGTCLIMFNISFSLTKSF